MGLRILFYDSADPYFNLAFEEALARARGEEIVGDTLRIWVNKNSSVVLGRFRKAENDVNMKNAEKFKIQIIRRFTGGGTVYHDEGCLNYSLAIKRDVNYPVDYLYSELLRGTLLALEELGLKPYLRNTNDVVVNGKKVSGTAAGLRWGVLFLHGSILVNSDLVKLYSLIRIPKKHDFDPVKYQVANLSAFVDNIKLEDVSEALARSYSRVLGEDFYFDTPTSKELKMAELLYKEKYSREEWNIRYPPEGREERIKEKIKEIRSQ